MVFQQVLLHDVQQHIKRLGMLTGSPFLVVGSLERYDFLPNHSDVNLQCFHDNSTSIVHTVKKEVPEAVATVVTVNLNLKPYRCPVVQYTIQGYPVSLLILPLETMPLMVEKHNHEASMPFFQQILLLTLKILYFYLHMMSKTFLYKCKQWIYGRNYGSLLYEVV